MHKIPRIGHSSSVEGNKNTTLAIAGNIVLNSNKLNLINGNNRSISKENGNTCKSKIYNNSLPEINLTQIDAFNKKYSEKQNLSISSRNMTLNEIMEEYEEVNCNDGYDKDNELVGTVQVKAGKINAKKQTVKISASATLIVNGAAKKVTAKAVAVDVDDAMGTTLTFKAPIGDMTFEMAADGTFTLKNDSYQMAKATIGGALKKNGAQGTVRLEGFDLAVPGEVQDQLLPYEETFSISGAKWSFAKNASVKWAKPKKDAELPEVYDEESGKGLIVDDAGGKTNLSSLKLTYTAKTGQFKGSFRAYALEGAGKATKLKKYTVNVAGFVVDGVGYGEASCKKPAAGPWTVRVE